jgi:hypothetical protein
MINLNTNKDDQNTEGFTRVAVIPVSSGIVITLTEVQIFTRFFCHED